ncbi:helix-turn-helix domain-containing protein [Lacicoccus alkaliphilus]|uniref:HTH cro/C1-type domain-containing protein n=1 Tax=Lacicoccus alkaliphilus DSM 16010 TaxID=1123231 RepID=A0A1M7GNT5_9BACL|nr:helix-turn-helix domain-containing protein [Salinicoccus alkaliphilus]SHM17547.1 Protein of unknown function [Salinicoccus alkaliphilus DSM 16010]
MKDQELLREYLKTELSERGLSLRELGKLSGINHATLSRIMNGKRKANLDHLHRLSAGLDVKVTDLLSSADESHNETDDFNKSLEAVQTLVKTTYPEMHSITLEQINAEIEKYEEQGATPRGRSEIEEKLKEKIQHAPLTGTFFNNIDQMYNDFMMRRGRPENIALMGAALLYFIVTVDLIPDYLAPVGLLDDALIVQLISRKLEHDNILM